MANKDEDARSIKASMRGDYYLTAKPSTCKTLSEVYEFFNRTFGVPGSVYYPGCDMDITPIASFPSSKVILLDINRKAVEALKRNGIEAIEKDARTYRPKDLHDLLILLNPGIKSKDATPALKIGGYVISNDWHGNTTQLLECPEEFDFKGILGKKDGLLNLMSDQRSRQVLAETNPFINLYAFFQRKQ